MNNVIQVTFPTSSAENNPFNLRHDIDRLGKHKMNHIW